MTGQSNSNTQQQFQVSGLEMDDLVQDCEILNLILQINVITYKLYNCWAKIGSNIHVHQICQDYDTCLFFVVFHDLDRFIAQEHLTQASPQLYTVIYLFLCVRLIQNICGLFLLPGLVQFYIFILLAHYIPQKTSGLD